jgi:hypothetical protein
MESEANTIQDVKWDLHLKPSTGPMEVIMDMHEMTHQKVEADQKWGAIPMNRDTIMQLNNFVWSSGNNKFNGDQKAILLDILDGWKKGNFSNIVAEHNELWQMLEGNVGIAYGKATKEQEDEYVVLHFGHKLKLFK